MRLNRVVKTAFFSIFTVSFSGGLVFGAIEPRASVAVSPLPDSSRIHIQPIEDHEPPATPRGISAKSGQAVELKWDPSTDHVTGLIGYRVYRNGERIAQVEGTLYNDSGVIAGETHRYQVSAVDGVGNESPLSKSVIVRSPELFLDIREAFCYPNPAVGGAVPVIRVEGSGIDTLQVKIFDTSGNLLEEGSMVSRGSSVVNKTAYEYEWTGPITSGIYFALVQGKTGDKSARAHLKIAVIR
jgi:hypothetical protein